MARRDTTDGGIRYTIADDDPAALDLMPWAVMRTRVIDELTLAAPVQQVTLTSTLARSQPRMADGGICGLVARPRDVSADLVRTTGFTAQVTVPGYLPRDLTPAIEVARRGLNSVAVAGVSTLDVVPTDPAPRAQFTPGRGVLIDRAPAVGQDFTTVAMTAAPPAPGDVPMSGPLPAPNRPVGGPVVGVPLTLPDQPLHRALPARLRGRIEARTGPNTLVPAVGASLGVLGVWWNYPSSVTAAPVVPDVCAVTPTLRLSHPVGASVDHCTLSPLGPTRTLRAPAPIETREIAIAPNFGLAPGGGDLLQIGDPLTGEDEVVVTDGFDAVADPNAVVRVRLRTPTAFIHRLNEQVQLTQMLGLTPVSTVARESLAGDSVLFAAGLTGLATTTTLVLEQGTPRAVFHRARQFPFTPNGVVFSHQIPVDAQGRFEWPPIARVAQLRLVARLAPFAPVQRDVALDYSGDATIAIILT
jgi:hypothetical protein